MTGSTAGIGLAIAERLASEGARVIVNTRKEQRIDAALKRLSRSGARVEGLPADLGTAAGLAEAIRRFPDLDILANNLGIYVCSPLASATNGASLRVDAGVVRSIV